MGDLCGGGSGLGQEQLAAQLHRDLLEAERGGSEFLLLSHAAGISPRSVQVDSLLQCWCEELALSLSVEPPGEEVRDAELDQQFARLLQEAAGRRRRRAVARCLEPVRAHAAGAEPHLAAGALAGQRAVDRHGDARKHRPGPRPAPGCSPSSAGPVDPGRRPATGPGGVRPLSPHDRLPGVRRPAGQRRPDGEPSRGNPLWLEMAVEQLNLLDAEDFALTRTLPQPGGKELAEDERVERMLLHLVERMPPTVAGLYGWMLERSEEIVPRELRGRLRMCWRWAGPGFASRTWKSCCRPSAAAARGIRSSSPRCGVLSGLTSSSAANRDTGIFHEQMRQAVVRRNLGDPVQTAELHRLIADHLLALPPNDPLRQTEAMYHLLGQGNRRRAADHYSEVPGPEVLLLLSGERRAEVLQRGRELPAATEAIADFLLAPCRWTAWPASRPTWMPGSIGCCPGYRHSRI